MDQERISELLTDLIKSVGKLRHEIKGLREIDLINIFTLQRIRIRIIEYKMI